MIKKRFFPVNRKDLKDRGWTSVDVILITGDAYVDHPSFGSALIGRFLESRGYRVGLISQPQKESDYMVLGRPELFFGITSGNLDSMVNHYTPQKKIRSEDAYTAGNLAGKRPDRAIIKYSQNVRKIYRDSVVVIGGIEASLRRIPHYDFMSEKIRNSILFDSRADILVYGMGERQVVEIARRLSSGDTPESILDIPGTVVSVKKVPDDGMLLPDFPGCSDTAVFHELNAVFFRNYPLKDLYLSAQGRILKHNVPQEPLSTLELDDLYRLGFNNQPHPMYGRTAVPAFEQIKNSVTSHRGCFGGCNFCAIGVHQGKVIQSRSSESICEEVGRLTGCPFFRGTVSDIGGPSANMYGMKCTENEPCMRRSCLFPARCVKLEADNSPLLSLLSRLSAIDGVRHLYTGSGIRFDIAGEEYIRMISENHVSGRLKLAPEHISDQVLRHMFKPGSELFDRFCRLFSQYSRKSGKNQEIVPYIMVGHPGETLDDTIKLAVFLKERGIQAYQVQEFTPTPMTISTCMYYTGLDFETSRKIHVPKGREIRLMKALVQYFMPENRKYVIEALKKAGKKNLLGYFLD